MTRPPIDSIKKAMDAFDAASATPRDIDAALLHDLVSAVEYLRQINNLPYTAVLYFCGKDKGTEFRDLRWTMDPPPGPQGPTDADASTSD